MLNAVLISMPEPRMTRADLFPKRGLSPDGGADLII